MSAFDVLVDFMDAFDDDFAVFAVNRQHSAASAGLISGHNLNDITFANVHIHQPSTAKSRISGENRSGAG